MGSMFVGVVFVAVWLLMGVPALILLLRSYGRTQMTGFLWLAAALVGWPLVARLLSMVMPMIAAAASLSIGQGMLGVGWLNVFIVVSLLETLVGGVLLLVALVILDRQLAARTPNRVAAPPVPPATF